jgi:hypothetical protein
LRRKRGELFEGRDDGVEGNCLSCRELAKDLAQNLIGQSDDAVAMCEGESDDVLTASIRYLGSWQSMNEAVEMEVSAAIQEDGRYGQAFTLRKATGRLDLCLVCVLQVELLMGGICAALFGTFRPQLGESRCAADYSRLSASSTAQQWVAVSLSFV